MSATGLLYSDLRKLIATPKLLENNDFGRRKAGVASESKSVLPRKLFIKIRSYEWLHIWPEQAKVPGVWSFTDRILICLCPYCFCIWPCFYALETLHMNLPASEDSCMCFVFESLLSDKHLPWAHTPEYLKCFPSALSTQFAIVPQNVTLGAKHQRRLLVLKAHTFVI